MKYCATIVSPKGVQPKSSIIEFESEHRAGSKQNLQDARYKMLDIYGEEAVSWTVKDVRRADESDMQGQEQLLLDFREPTEPVVRKRRRSVKRGITNSGL